MQRYHAGRLDDAAGLLQAALKTDPRHIASRQALAAMLIDRRESRQAQVILQEGLALDPAQSAFATMSARLSLAAGDAEGAVKTLQAAAIDQAPPELHAMLAGVLSRLRRDREALTHWNAALQRNPAQANWWLGLGVSLEADGRAQDARTAFERALGVPGLRPEAADYARERLNAAR
jgi:MSHA biogenesis protein MshN